MTFHPTTIEGIPCFSPDRYWGKASKEELERALKLLEERGWEEFKNKYEGRFDFTFEYNRADWRFPVALNKSSVVLDLGAGMGRSAIPLAFAAGKVVAVDGSFLRMKFLKLRARHEGLSNVEPYVGDVFDLPFAPESFDLIAMNGVLEWVGLTDRFSDPREAQLEALRICRRLLKPGGTLYVGIENRFALSYVRALDHSGLRYTSYMPRFLADLYMRVRIGRRYQTYTYSARGYRKLMREAGFGAPDLHLVYPGYNVPRLLVPYENLNLLRYAISSLMQGGGVKRSAAKRLGRFTPLLLLYRFVFFSYAMYVKK